VLQFSRVSSSQLKTRPISIDSGLPPKEGMNAHRSRSNRVFGGVEAPGRSLPWGDDNRSTKRNAASSALGGTDHADDVPDRVLSACAQDMLSLWNDPFLQKLLCGPLETGGLGLRLHEDASL